MNILQYIFSCTAVVDIHFRVNETPVMQLCICHSDGRSISTNESIEAIAGQYVMIAVCSGAGVVTRPLRGDAAEKRIKSDEREFIWNETSDGISFMRRTTLVPILSSMKGRGVTIQSIYCNMSPADAATVFRESVTWRALLRIDDCGSVLCMSIVKRAMLPMLIMYFIAVAASLFLGNRYSRREQFLQQKLESLDEYQRSSSIYTAELTQLGKAFVQHLPMKYSVICDRIGRGVPTGIRLTTLDVEPLVKQYKSGETLKHIERHVSISGRCNDPALVSSFVNYLSKQPQFVKVELHSLSRTRDNAIDFRIKIWL